MQYDNETKELIEQLDKQAKEIQAKIDELKNNENKCVRWRAKKGEQFYIVSGYTDGKVTIFHESSTHKGFDDFLYKTGNYFKTAQEAEKHYKYLIITQKLKDIALRLNDGVEIDFRKNSKNYCIVLDHYPAQDTGKARLHQIFNDAHRSAGATYCLSDKFLETAIKEIGEKELIEYIKGC